MNLTTPPQLAAAYIRKHIAEDFTPALGIILGSGLGVLADELTEATTLSYDDIPGFFNCSVAGHGGHLHLGYLKGIPVVCLQGRPHFYEGISNQDILTPVRTLKLLGCDTLISTNASGSLHEAVQPGSLVLIKDHINFQFNNPLVGPNDDNYGCRFVGMEDTYDPALREQFKKIAGEQNITLTEGVYFGVLGPSFETPAEINAYRLLGGDVVGMSTIPEVIAARHCGLRVNVIAVITNMAAGMTDTKLSHEETLRGAKLATDKLITLFHAFFEQYKQLAVES